MTNSNYAKFQREVAAAKATLKKAGDHLFGRSDLIQAIADAQSTVGIYNLAAFYFGSRYNEETYVKYDKTIAAFIKHRDLISALRSRPQAPHIVGISAFAVDGFQDEPTETKLAVVSAIQGLVDKIAVTNAYLAWASANERPTNHELGSAPAKATSPCMTDEQPTKRRCVEDAWSAYVERLRRLSAEPLAAILKPLTPGQLAAFQAEWKVMDRGWYDDVSLLLTAGIFAQRARSGVLKAPADPPTSDPAATAMDSYVSGIEKLHRDRFIRGNFSCAELVDGMITNVSLHLLMKDIPQTPDDLQARPWSAGPAAQFDEQKAYIAPAHWEDDARIVYKDAVSVCNPAFSAEDGWHGWNHEYTMAVLAKFNAEEDSMKIDVHDLLADPERYFRPEAMWGELLALRTSARYIPESSSSDDECDDPVLEKEYGSWTMEELERD